MITDKWIQESINIMAKFWESHDVECSFLKEYYPHLNKNFLVELLVHRKYKEWYLYKKLIKSINMSKIYLICTDWPRDEIIKHIEQEIINIVAKYSPQKPPKDPKFKQLYL